MNPLNRTVFCFKASLHLAATLALALLVLAPAAANATEGLFWKASGSGGVAYLLGSLHFGTEAIYPLDSEIQDAFAKADRLAVEIDLQSVDPGALALWIAENGAYVDGTTLADHVSTDTWSALQQRAAEIGVPVELIAFQRPWLAALTLTAVALVHGGFREDLGIDRYFLERAAGRMPIVELETAQSQMDLLSGLSTDQQEALLAATLRDLASGTDAFENIVDAWRRGDDAALDVQVNTTLRATGFGDALFEQLIERRNGQMSDKIAALLEGGGTTFVVVGAAHLVGAGGVPALLKQRGYRVEKP